MNSMESHKMKIFRSDREEEMKLYNDKNDVYYMFDKSELYFILAQCVVTGASLATTAFWFIQIAKL